MHDCAMQGLGHDVNQVGKSEYEQLGMWDLEKRAAKEDSFD